MSTFGHRIGTGAVAARVAARVAAVVAVIVAVIVVLASASARGEPTVHQPQWTLLRTIGFTSPYTVHIPPTGRTLLVVRTGTAFDGIYRVQLTAGSEFWLEAPDPPCLLTDPGDGDLFFTRVSIPLILRVAAGGNTYETWLSQFGAQVDDDPVGLALLPDDYAGGVAPAGWGLVVDGGWDNYNGVFAWSLDTSRTHTTIVENSPLLVHPVDITADAKRVFLVDEGRPGTEAVVEVLPGGALAPLTTSEPLTLPRGITSDPRTGDLVVGDVTDQRIVTIDPATGAVANLVTEIPLGGRSVVDMSPDGSLLVAAGGDANAIYVLGRCDAGETPDEDCNGNGIRDFCDIVGGGVPDCNGNGIPDDCDIAQGTSGDCNGDGIPDECAACPPVEVVIVMDTSPSMAGEGEELCVSIENVVGALRVAGIEVIPTFYGITNTAFSCLHATVEDAFGTVVPGDPPAAIGTLATSEDWGPAVAIIADAHPWLPEAMSLRIIVPMADEGPYRGGLVMDQLDSLSVDHAAMLARSHAITVSPIVGDGASEGVVGLAERLAALTGGVAHTSSATAQEIAQVLTDMILDQCWQWIDCNHNGIPDACDIASGFSHDADGDGIPDECAATGVRDDGRAPRADLVAIAGYPNPFNPRTTLVFSLPEAGVVDLTIHDVTGRLVCTLARQAPLTPGRHEVQWTGRDDAGRAAPSGVYVARLACGAGQAMCRLVLLR